MGIAVTRHRPKPEWGKRIGRFYNASSRRTHVTLGSRAISTSHFQPDLAFPTSRDTHRHLGNLAAGNLGSKREPASLGRRSDPAQLSPRTKVTRSLVAGLHSRVRAGPSLMTAFGPIGRAGPGRQD